jgi:enhancing lycopene biosynthesis protein 2
LLYSKGRVHGLFARSLIKESQPVCAMADFALILSGCGFLDGSDVWEVVLLSHYLGRNGKSPAFFAPDAIQKEVVDHLSRTSTGQTRNVLAESARIAWSGIREMGQLSGKDVEGLLLPGGEGAVKNLADWVGEGEDRYLRPQKELQRVIREMYRRKKPIGACGLSGLLVASALRDIVDAPLTLTVGKDPELIRQAERMGAVHVLSRGPEAVMDSDHRVVSTPSHLLKLSPAETAVGIENLINGVLELTSSKTS